MIGMTTTLVFVLSMGLAYGVAALLALRPAGAPGRRAAPVLAAAGSVAGSVAAVLTILGRGSFTLEIPSALPELALVFRLDPLGSAFLFLTGLVGAPAAVYSLDYAPGGHGARAGRLAGALLPLFLLSMSLVVMAANAFTFLLFWEAMT